MWVEKLRWVRVDDPRVRTLPVDAHMRLSLGGHTLRLVRTPAGLFALEDRCPHQGRSFEGGWCEDGCLVCPWHRFAYDPATGRARQGSTVNVGTFPVEQRENGLHIGFPYTTFRLFGIDLW
ncbi:MAG: Rieske (2Fe-2S) protein [Flavobacteriales bacterium]|nr:hypothetical protein [Flavobacteriales bacterium]MCC6576872.1 Rieske (2Fe-2S) protein [Flavobacteriales bacterium]